MALVGTGWPKFLLLHRNGHWKCIDSTSDTRQSLVNSGLYWLRALTIERPAYFGNVCCINNSHWMNCQCLIICFSHSFKWDSINHFRIFFVCVLLVNDSLHQGTPLDVATKRGHEDITKILRGGGISNVSTTVSNLSLGYSQHFQSTWKKICNCGYKFWSNHWFHCLTTKVSANLDATFPYLLWFHYQFLIKQIKLFIHVMLDSMHVQCVDPLLTMSFSSLLLNPTSQSHVEWEGRGRGKNELGQ